MVLRNKEIRASGGAGAEKEQFSYIPRMSPRLEIGEAGYLNRLHLT